MKAKIVAAAVSVAMLAGCSSKISAIQAFDEQAISAVQAEIKREIGIYLRAQKIDPYYVVEKDHKREMVTVKTTESDFRCGKGNIAYDLQKVEAQLTTTITNSFDAGLTLTIPVQMVTVGGGGTYSKEVTNTQTLKYSVWVIGFDDQPPEFKNAEASTLELIDSAPIAGTLLNLRNSQIFSAMKTNPATGIPNPWPQPCVSNADLGKPSDTSGEYDLGISTKIDGSGKVSISLAVVTANIGGERKSVTGNDLIVTFQPQGLQELQEAVDTATKNCAGAKKNSALCKVGHDHVHALVQQHNLIGRVSHDTTFFNQLREMAK